MHIEQVTVQVALIISLPGGHVKPGMQIALRS